MEKLRCAVERITCRNAPNGYTELKCHAKGYSDLVTLVGAMPEVHVGAVRSLAGEWKTDSKYGTQIGMESFEEPRQQQWLGSKRGESLHPPNGPMWWSLS